ncbi:MAG: hypothetical protein ACRCUY_08605 [Thermoguttaceae bacterium]
MRKLKLYLDTSVISNIDAPHVPDKEVITQQFFQMVTEHADEYELFISPMGITEIENCPKSKRSLFSAFLSRLEYTEIQESKEAKDLSQLYVTHGVLGERHIKDLTHIAYAVIARCDYIISWNMKHFVRIQTISRVNEVNFLYHYPNIFIATPLIITGENYENG